MNNVYTANQTKAKLNNKKNTHTRLTYKYNFNSRQYLTVQYTFLATLFTIFLLLYFYLTFILSSWFRFVHTRNKSNKKQNKLKVMNKKKITKLTRRTDWIQRDRNTQLRRCYKEHIHRHFEICRGECAALHTYSHLKTV